MEQWCILLWILVSSAANGAAVLVSWLLDNVARFAAWWEKLPAAVKKAAFNAGASGVAISGAGPAVIAVLDDTEVSASDVAGAMREAFLGAGVQCEACCSKPSFKGTAKALL